MLVEITNFFLSPLFSLFGPYFTNAFNSLTSQKTQRAAIKSFFITAVIAFLVSIALVAYFAFYMIYIPKIAHVKPVYLQYQKEGDPYAIVDFTENGRYDSILTADQAYDVSIDLDVPSSDRNAALGNFMVGINLMAKNETVQSSSRPCILTYQSGIFRVVYTLSRLIPLVLGFTKEDQKLTITMFENMIESAEKPITRAFITISNSNLEVYKTQIRLDAHFRGLRYFMYYHSIPTAIIFTFTFLLWEILFSIAAWKSFVSWWQTKSTLVTPPPPVTHVATNTIQDKDENVQTDLDQYPEPIETDVGTITETETEDESSRPGSIISPTDTALVSESGEMGYGTESYFTDGNETHSITSRTMDYESSTDEIEEEEDDDDDEQTEGSATPTKNRKSTLYESEDGPNSNNATSTSSRLQSGSTRPYIRRSDSNGGNNESNIE